MCCTQTEELVPGHCLIVPLQHHMSTLEMEDDDWEEVRVSESVSAHCHQGVKAYAIAELHEMPYADACQGQQRSTVL